MPITARGAFCPLAVFSKEIVAIMKKSHSQRINRINYIVLENPYGVAALLKEEGKSVPSDLKGLLAATKKWVRIDGKDAILKLLQVHPEKEAILKANQKNVYDHFDGCSCKCSFSGEECKGKDSFDGSDCYCGTCSSFSEEPIAIEGSEDLEHLSLVELFAQYEELKKHLRRYPKDVDIRQRLKKTRSYLKQKLRKKEKEQEKVKEKKASSQKSAAKSAFGFRSKELAVGSIILGIALIISQLKS